MSYVIIFDDELMHHGRMGQKWGERHGPPYPLRPGAFNRSPVSVIKKKLKSERGAVSVSETKKESQTSDESKRKKYDEIYKEALRMTNGDEYEARLAVADAEARDKVAEKMERAKDFISKMARGTEEGFGKAGDKIAESHAKQKAEKAAKIEAENERVRAEKAAERERFLKTASAKELLARQDEFTNQELQDAIERIKKRNTLAGIDDSTKSAGKKFLDTALGALKYGNDYANTGIATYNNIAKLYNTFSSEDSKKMKIIKDNDKKKENNKK